ncbi:MAG: crosslink repair DNA glycosylase YcaQ family protein [Betaproteobacteria bacterium]
MTTTRPITLGQLRTHAIARSLFVPTTLPAAFRRMGFVQADPIRAPARAQDLILRHRVKNYRDGDLERRYPRLSIEEDVLHNYGFLQRDVQPLLHPRLLKVAPRIERSHPKLSAAVLAFVRDNGPTHPRDLDADHGASSVRNYWGGSSSAATHMLDGLHYRGALRVVRRVGGIRVYAVAEHLPIAPDPPAMTAEKVRRLVGLVASLYAPLPEASLRRLVLMLRYGAPHYEPHLADRATIARAIDAGHLVRAHVDGINWVLPPNERLIDDVADRVRLLAPFDPVVWDRHRFELFWGWRYRFEAYTQPAKRVLGYYALPLLWRDQVIGWVNVANDGERLSADIGFSRPRPRAAAFRRELDTELEAMAVFVGVEGIARMRWL